MHCCWPAVDILWSKLYIFNQYIPHPGNTDKHKKTSEFVAKNICVTNHNIYAITYCMYNHSQIQTANGMAIYLCSLRFPQIPSLSLPVASFLPFLSDLKIEHMRFQCRRWWRADTTHRVGGSPYLILNGGLSPLCLTPNVLYSIDLQPTN